MTLSRNTVLAAVALALAGLVAAVAWLVVLPLVSPDRSCKTFQRQAEAFEAKQMREASGNSPSRDDKRSMTEQIGGTAFETCEDSPGAMVRKLGERELRSWGTEREAPK